MANVLIPEVKTILKRIALTGLLIAVFAGKGFCATYDWVGTTATLGVYNWNNKLNWQVAGVAATTVPGAADIVQIGISSFTNNPTITDAQSCASIVFGTYDNFTLTVNGTLTVSGTITQQNDPNFYQYTVLAGTGTITCTGFILGDSTAPNSSVGVVNNVSCQISQMTINGNLTLNAVGNASNNGIEYPYFSLDANKLTISGQIITTSTGTPLANGVGDPTYPGIGLFQMDSGTANTTLELTNVSPISTPVKTNFTIDFTNNGTGTGTVLYDAASGTQTIYTTATTGIGINNYNYDALTFGGASAKTVLGNALTVGGAWTTGGTGAVNLNTNNPTITVTGNLVNSVNITQGSGNITINGLLQNNAGTVTLGSGTLGITGVLQINAGTIAGGAGAVTVGGVFQNNAGTFTGGSGSLTFNGGYTNSGTFTAGSGTIYFGGTSQTLQDNSAAGTTFNNVTFNGSGTVTIGAGVGNFSVAATGVLTMVSPAKLVAGGAATGYLTLKSSAASSATVAAISGTSTITGVVNVQRYMTGGSMSYRSYRTMSSPVYASTVSSNNVFSINYLKTSSYLTGSTGTLGGFDKTGNPTIYLYRENLTPGNTSFTSGNFRGLNNISASPGYQLDSEVGTFNIPAGNGFLFYFRGNRSTTLATKTVTPYATPENTTYTSSGILNQGQITVHDWYTPASATLGYTVLAGNTTVRGFNLVGNPYASSINWDLFNTTTTTSGIYGTAVGTTIYVLDPVSKNYGAYTKGTGGIGTHNTSNILPSGQGFFVLASSATAKLIFNESAKVNTQVTGVNLLMGKPVDFTNIQYIHLQLAKDSVNTDDIIVRFTDNAVSKYDPEVDGPYKPGMGVVSLASLSSDNVQLAINTQPLPETSETVPLVAGAAADGAYQFQLKGIVGLPKLFSVWLVDNYTKDSIDMRETLVYSFNLVHADSSSSSLSRFKLVISQNTGYAYRLLDFGAKMYTSLNQVRLNWKTVNEQNYTQFTVERSNDGSKTYTTTIGGMRSNAQGSYALTDQSPQNGTNFYRLKQVDINGNITYSKVATVEYSEPSNSLLSNNLSIYPNPVAGNINLSIKDLTDAKTATYHIRISNSLGRVVRDIKSPQPYWQGNVNDLLTGTYVIEVENTKDQSLIGKTKFVKL